MSDPFSLTDDLIERMIRRRSARGDVTGLERETRAAVAVTEQRWRRLRRVASWMPRLGHSRALPATALIAAVLVVVVGLAVFGRLTEAVGVPTPGGLPVVAPTPGPTSTPRPTWTPGACGNGAPTCAGPLSAGEHRSIAFDPAFTYRVPEGWGNSIDMASMFEMGAIRGDPASFLMLSNVINGEFDGCWLGTVTPRSADTVDEWVDFVLAHPALDATAPRPIEVGGATGQVVDISLAKPGCASDVAFILQDDGLVPEPGRRYGVAAFSSMRLYILDVDGRIVLIPTEAESSDDRFVATLAELESLIESIHFDPAD